MSATLSFAKRYFTSWVSKTALGMLIVALAVAWVSTKTGVWWTGYLQSLSTGLICIAPTVWLINFLIELQSHQLSSELRTSTEIAALSSLQSLLRHLPQWVPQVQVPEAVYLPQLEWVQHQIDHLRALCATIIPGANDPELQESLNHFNLCQAKWSKAMEDLDLLLRMTAPARELASAFEGLRECTDSLLASARTLANILSRRHDHRKPVLGIARN